MPNIFQYENFHISELSERERFSPQWTFREGTKYRLTEYGTWYSSPAASSAPGLQPTPSEEVVGYVRIARPYAIQVSRDGATWTTSPKGGLPEALTVLIGLPERDQYSTGSSRAT